MEKYTSRFHHDRECKEIIVSYSSYFRGCEEKIVIIDLSDPAIKIENLMESLTRCLSQLVLIDTGIDHPDNKKDYEDVKGKILTATDQGLARIEDITTEDIEKDEAQYILRLK
ncbi:hypothetical protein HOLleu_30458 [Holothuria leucospilota]|uniref:Uncharacterized protein n=1 Tax=Holothuria leucospilota TaxID=206669 RepID=A0A9Q1BKG7_HOLLE|nr:hypothetical protein HOLleu_30458 [Holothuria leucospilota]